MGGKADGKAGAKEIENDAVCIHNTMDESTLPLATYLRMHPTTVPYRQISIIGFRPYLSLAPPITKLEMATPSSAAIGTKYVAAEKSNGAVVGNESSVPP